MTESNVYTVEVSALVYGGDALGRLPDRRAVFVAGALPGEKVRVRLVEQKQRFARGVLLEVMEAAPERIDPPHPDCPGCHYQYMTYSAQLRAKRAIVRDQLTRIAGVNAPPVAEVIPSPKEWHYRNSVQFHLTEDARLGFQEPGSHKVVPMEECALCEEPLAEMLELLEFEAVPEGVERVQLRLGANEEIMLVFESRTPQPPDLSVDLPVSAVHLFTDDRGIQHPVVMAGDDHLVVEANGRAFRVSAASFFQVNTQQAENMLRYLLELLPVESRTNLLEVYAGVGLFSAFFAPRAGRLAAVESSPSAVEDFAANLDEFDNVDLYDGPAEMVLPALKTRPDLILVDPPRAGLALPVIDAVVRLAPPLLAYVSCDPATLARDVKRLLKAGYHLESVQPFDMFPQTYHVECVALMKKDIMSG